jgi:uncharacterized membrane protein YkgB
MHFLKKLTRTHLTLIAVAVLFLFAFFSTFVMLRWKETEHVGIISAIDKNSFTITNPHSETRIVELTPDTQIYKGRTKDVSLEVGNTVLVVGKTNEQGNISAEMIRIIKPPKKPYPRESGEETQVEM